MSDKFCQDGTRACPECARLLNRANHLYEKWRENRRTKDWLTYLTAKQEYDRHKEREE